MREIRIHPVGIRNMYSQICKKYIFTHTADIYLYDYGILQRIGHVMREKSGNTSYYLTEDFTCLLPEVKIELTKTLGYGGWPSVTHYPIRIEVATQTESEEALPPLAPVTPSDTQEVLCTDSQTLVAAPVLRTISRTASSTEHGSDSDTSNKTVPGDADMQHVIRRRPSMS